MTVDRVALLTTAIKFALNGVAVVPVRVDGTKAPALPTWKQYQDARPANSQVAAWFDIGKKTTDGVGVLTGATSNLEMLEAEGRAIDEGTWAEFLQLCHDNGAGDVIDRVMAGYTEQTPSGGIHLLYRLADGVPRPNTKLASRPATEAELAGDPFNKVKPLIETRGEGGFVVVAPSAGRSLDRVKHPPGSSWHITAGGIDTIATITIDERDRLWALATMLDQMPERGHSEPERAVARIPGSDRGDRPGDQWMRETSWAEILEPHGWTRAYALGPGWTWYRPGKTRGSISATTGTRGDTDCLYVFSTSTDLETERPLSKLFVLAHYEHGGDMSAAAKALAAKGFGSPPTISTEVVPGKGVAAILPTVRKPGPSTPGQPASAAVSDALFTQPAGDADDEEPAPAIDETPASGTVIVEAPAMTLLQSEDGHSQALIAEYGADLRFCPQTGRWLHWDGWRWATQPGDGGIAREYAKAIARALPSGDDWKAHKKRSLSAAGVAACLALTRTDHRITVDVDELDARPWELNTPAGIVDLRTGTLGPAIRSHMHTRTTTVAPDPDADVTPWLSFLDTTFQGDTELIGFVQRLMGYACVGEVRESILPVFYGALGANGKTVLLETVQQLLGDYATTTAGRFLVQGPAQHPTEIAKLAGVRFVVASETNEGERFDEAKVKLLTGGDRLSARFMRQDEFTFTPSHLLVMMTNHRIEVAAGGPAMWRRLREVPFEHQVPIEQRDPALRERLVAEHGPAIMAWLVAGAAEYARIGLAEPDGVRRATADYEASTDTVAQFVEARLLIGGGEAVKARSADVRAAYEHWCRVEGETPIPPKALTTRLTSGYPVTTFKGTGGVRFLTGITLVNEHADDNRGVQFEPAHAPLDAPLPQSLPTQGELL